MVWTLKFWNSNPQAGPIVTWNYSGNSNPPLPQPGDVPAQPGMATDITNYLNSIASLSTYAQNRLNAFGQDIRFGYQAGNVGQAVWRGGTDPYVLIDLTAATQMYFFNTEGKLVLGDARLTIMHELAHIYLNDFDPKKNAIDVEMNAADFDFRGPVINEQNLIALDAHLTDQIQTSYYATVQSTDAFLFAQFSTSISYSNGAMIDTTRLGTSGANNINHSQNTILIHDLLFGLDGDDEIWSGIGDDYVYGGDNKDTIYSGAGNDEYWGGMRAETGRSDGIDTVDYSAATNGIEISIGGTTVAVTSVQDGGGGTDTLHSIEEIKGSSLVDTLTLTALNSTIAGAFDWIDLGAGTDLIDVSGLNGVVRVDLTNATNQTIDFGGAVLHVLNAEHVRTGGGNDIVTPSTAVVATLDLGAGNDLIRLAGGNHTILAGDGYDTLNLSTVVTGSRIAIEAGSALVRGNGTSTINSIEEVVGGGGSNTMYGDGSGTTLVGGTGLNYLEGSGDDILKSGEGDTYFSLTNGGTIISGAGNDYIEVNGDAPVTIKFGVGSGHDMLGSYFSSSPDTSWVDERQNDLIVLDGLTKDDIELVWDYTRIDYFDYLYDDDPTSELLNDWHDLAGNAAIRIISTGETLYLGHISYWYEITGAWAYIGTAMSGEFEPDDRTISLDWDWIAEQAALNFAYNQTVGYPYNYRQDWSHRELPVDNANDWYEESVDFDIFSFDGVTRLSLFDLFELDEITSQPLPAEATAAQDILDRLAQGSAGGVSAGTAGNDTVGGDGSDNDILGGAGDDTVDGGAGDDFLRGGIGNDNLTGGSGNDQIGGQDGNDSLLGGEGNDTLDGGVGTDAMAGGIGDDIYVVDASGDATVELAGEGVDLIRSSVTRTLGANFEHLTLTGSAGIYGTGNELANTITGNAGSNKLYGLDGADLLTGDAGADRLDGGLGADALHGGLGDDAYIVDHAADLVVEGSNEGKDHVHAGLTYALGANVEHLTLTGSAAIDGTGNELANTITGNGGVNSLSGGLGNDWLDGGAGRDTVTGGAGADLFAFDAMTDFAGLTVSTSDMISDFSHAEGDRFRVRDIDANSLIAGDQNFAFIGGAAFSNIAGQLRYEQIDGNTYVTGDTNGDSIADFMIRLDGLHTLVNNDFIL